MKWCDRCRIYTGDEAHFCSRCGYPLRVVPDLTSGGTPLNEDLTLGGKNVDGYITRPDGTRERAGRGFSVNYHHRQRCVLYRSWSGGDEPDLDLLKIPDEIRTKESLTAYIRQQRPHWMFD